VDTLFLLGDGSSAQDSLAKVPHHLIVDRCYIHAFPTQALKRGIGLHGAETTISNSYVSDFKLIGQDSQAIAGWNGPGPFKIINNYLEAAGENIVFGGATPSIPGLIPSDIEIRRNYLSKPLSWRQRDRTYGGTPWSVKNLFELKSARRVQVTGNVMENQWSDVNSGYGAVNLTVRGDSGSQATIENVEFSSNVVRHAGLALNILGKDTVSASQQGRDLRIRNNLFEDINSERWNDSGGFLKISQMEDVVVDHNTVLHDGLIILVYGSSGNKGFVFTNNIVSNNAYGVVGQGTGSISGSLSMFFPGAAIRRNVVVGGDASQYPPGNFYPKGLGEVGFNNAGGAEYQLSAGSAYRGRATDGKDIGCDLTAVMTAARIAMAGVGN
jgi:hypothetical protein